MFPSPFEIKNSELHREAMLPSVAGKIMRLVENMSLLIAIFGHIVKYLFHEYLS